MTPDETLSERDRQEVRREAERRIRRALDLIERAQNDIGSACSEISSVIGLVHEWERLGGAADMVKAEWHKLAQVTRGQRWDLDEGSARAHLSRVREERDALAEDYSEARRKGEES